LFYEKSFKSIDEADREKEMNSSFNGEEDY